MSPKSYSSTKRLVAILSLVALSAGCSSVVAGRSGCKLLAEAPVFEPSKVQYVVSDDGETLVGISGYLEFTKEHSFVPIYVRQVNVSEIFEEFENDNKFIVFLNTDCGVIELSWGRSLGSSGIKLYNFLDYARPLHSFHPAMSTAFSPNGSHVEYNEPQTEVIYDYMNRGQGFLHFDLLQAESKGDPNQLRKHKFSRKAIDLVAEVKAKEKREAEALAETRRRFNGKDGAC